MDNSLVVILVVALAVTLCVLILVISAWRRSHLSLRTLQHISHSRSTRHGQTVEQFMPFLPIFPWNPERFRFIGSPIDGIQFEEDKIIFVEFKTGSSRLSNKQRQIRNLIISNKVEFEEFRID